MLEMQICGIERPLFQRFAVRLEIPVAESGQGQAKRAGSRSIARGRFAVELDELDDVDARRQLDQTLLEPQEQVLDMGGPGFGLLRDTWPMVKVRRFPGDGR